MKDLSTIVEEDPLLMNDELCEALEEPTIKELYLSPTAGTPSDVTEGSCTHISVLSQSQSDDEDEPPSDNELTE